MASNAELPIKEENIDDADFESSDLPEYDNKNEPFDSELEGDSQNLWLKNCRLPTLSSHFFGNYMNIFHKSKVQTCSEPQNDCVYSIGNVVATWLKWL